MAFDSLFKFASFPVQILIVVSSDELATIVNVG